MNFRWLAPHYDWLEAVTAGSRLQQARTHDLESLADCAHVLSVGEGHGRFAAACLARFPAIRLTCVEADPAMAAVGRRRTQPWADRVEWVQLDVLAWRPTQQYDAVVTCFFLDCFPPETLGRVVERLAGAGAAGAPWLVVDFALPAAGPARWRARAVHALMYAFFRVVTRLPARRLTPPDGFLAAHGFVRERRHAFDWGLISAARWRRA